MSSTSTNTSELLDPATERLLSYGSWVIESHPAVTAQATATQPAAGFNKENQGIRNVLKNISASVACGATAQTPLFIFVRDGASGVGTIIWSRAVAAVAGTVASVDITGLEIVGSPNTAMTVEFSAGGVAASQETVAASGYLAIQ